MTHGVPNCPNALPLSVPVCDVSPQVAAVPDEFTVRLRVTDWFCAGVLESVTANVSEVALAVAVGVPLIAPVAGASVSPAGSAPPVKVHAYGVVPPVAANVTL